MNDGDVQPVLRCQQCNKPFDRQSTLKRHGYYCRSRKGVNVTRTRSCVSCATGKSRCDNQRPKCSRCIAKGIECHYPAAKTSRSTRPMNQDVDDASRTHCTIASSVTPAFSNLEIPQELSATTLDDVLAIPGSEFANLGQGYFDWPTTDMQYTDFLNLSTETIEQPIIMAYPTPPSHSTPLEEQTIQGRHIVLSKSPPIVRPPTRFARSFMLKSGNGSQRIATLTLHTLRSYSRSMLRSHSLPPFIHPEVISGVFDDKELEPLSNCISLVHMISSGVRGSRKLFWKNVRLECERLLAECTDLDRWQLLGAMQALTVYLLMRLDEGETDDNNCDVLIIQTVAAMSKQIMCVNDLCNTESAACSYGGNISWQDWIYEESRRRVSVVYRVIGMLIYFEPSSLCNLQTDLVLAPLPGRKQLWEASNESVWKTEISKDTESMTSYALARSGELVKLYEGQMYCADAVLRYKGLGHNGDMGNGRAVSSWEEWCSGMDGFGSLVMLTASLVG